MAMSGTTAGDARLAPASLRSSAHCIAKASSAIVATERPTKMREIQVSCRHTRGTSIIGKTDRNAQPRTYAAESHSSRRRVVYAPAGIYSLRRPSIHAEAPHAATFATAATHSAAHQINGALETISSPPLVDAPFSVS